MNLKTKAIALLAGSALALSMTAGVVADDATGKVTVKNTGILTANIDQGFFNFEDAFVTGLVGGTVTGDINLTIHNSAQDANFTVAISSTGQFTDGTTTWTADTLTASPGTLVLGGADWEEGAAATDVLGSGTVLTGSDIAVIGKLPIDLSLRVPARTPSGTYTNTITVSAEYI